MQYLEEDPRTNRIDDSLQLFTQICSNKLLKDTHLVLFLSMSGFDYSILIRVQCADRFLQTRPISCGRRLPGESRLRSSACESHSHVLLRD